MRKLSFIAIFRTVPGADGVSWCVPTSLLDVVAGDRSAGQYSGCCGIRRQVEMRRGWSAGVPGPGRALSVEHPQFVVHRFVLSRHLLFLLSRKVP
jgi:hypothetical protein